jgi:hypothetical protein
VAAHNGYVLFDSRDGVTRLIDMNGNVVKSWKYIGFPSEMISPRVNSGKRGHVLVQLSGKISHGPIAFGNIFNNKEVAELDWNGKVVWKWGTQAPDGAANQNHDWFRHGNGSTYILSTHDRSIKGFSTPKVTDQVIYEVKQDGKIAWQWFAADHLSEFGFSVEGLNLIKRGFTTTGGGSGFLNLNDMHPVGPNRWFASGDQRFNPENIIIDSREGNFIAIIERASGKIVYRLGPYYDEKGEAPSRRIFRSKLPRPVDQLSGQHDAHIIDEGLPGAGNLLVFDNQGAAGFPQVALGSFRGSRVLEIDPLKKEIVWQYTGASSGYDVWTFDSSFISSARRLPNGNTLICEGAYGRIFQVTPTGGIVWEYVNPYYARESQGGPELLTNWTYRAQPVPYDWVPAGTPRSEKAVTPPANMRH